MKKFSLLLILFALFASAGAWSFFWGNQTTSHAAPMTNVITVTTLDDSIFPDDACSLREAIDNINNYSRQEFAVDGDNECPAGSPTQPNIIVLQSNATYQLSNVGTGDTEGDLDIREPLRIETDGADKAIIHIIVLGERVMEIHNTAVELHNIILSGGSAVENGGGILNNGGTITLTQLILRDNEANLGAGLYNDGGSVTIEGTTITDNKAVLGGGGLFNNQQMTISTESDITNNEATGGNGGGIANSGTLLIDGGSSVAGNNALFSGGGILNQAGGTVTIHGATVTSNEADESGGGIYNDESTLLIDQGDVSLNTSLRHGGGIYSNHILTMTNGTIMRGNQIAEGVPSAQYGGAVYQIGGQLHIDDSSFSVNRIDSSGGAGGAIFYQYDQNLAGQAVISNSLIQGNSVSHAGGGILVGGGTDGVLITGTTVTGNTALKAPGILAAGITADNCDAPPLVRIHNSTISGNIAMNNATFGAAVLIDWGSVEILHSTITANEAPDHHVAGVMVWKPGDVPAVVCARIGHSIIAGNNLHGEGDFYYGAEDTELISLGHNVIGTSSEQGDLDFNIHFTATDDLTNVVDAGLDVLTDNGGPTLTHALLDESPAIGRGNPAICAAAEGTNGVDQRGFARDTIACDSGAYESGLTLAVALAGDGTGSVDSDPQGIACEAVNCVQKFEHETVITLTATPEGESIFMGWTGTVVNQENPLVITMSSTQQLTATFGTSPPNSYLLTVSKAGDGSGTVTSNPAGINCGQTCAAFFGEGSMVTLTATPTAGSEFTGWTGAVTSQNQTIELTMDEAKNVTATFEVGEDPETGYRLYLPIVTR